jgi:hypothetical protein
MTGWHVDNEPFAGAISHTLERLSHSLVVTPANEGRPDLFYEL